MVAFAIAGGGGGDGGNETVGSSVGMIGTTVWEIFAEIGIKSDICGVGKSEVVAALELVGNGELVDEMDLVGGLELATGRELVGEREITGFAGRNSTKPFDLVWCLYFCAKTAINTIDATSSKLARMISMTKVTLFPFRIVIWWFPMVVLPQYEFW
jgi:hypothetical protein